MPKARYDADRAIIFPACLGCPGYDRAVREEFCQRGFDGDCPRGYINKNATAEVGVER